MSLTLINPKPNACSVAGHSRSHLVLMQVQIHAASSVIAPYLHLYANAMACQCEQRENARRKKSRDAKYLVVSICCCYVLESFLWILSLFKCSKRSKLMCRGRRPCSVLAFFEKFKWPHRVCVCVCERLQFHATGSVGHICSAVNQLQARKEQTDGRRHFCTILLANSNLTYFTDVEMCESFSQIVHHMNCCR